MSQKNFEKWVTAGPDTMSYEDTLAALQWRDANPSEASVIQRAHDSDKRDAARREDLIHAARARGVSDTEAARFAEVYLDEERERSIRESDEAARHNDRQHLLNNF